MPRPKSAANGGRRTERCRRRPRSWRPRAERLNVRRAALKLLARSRGCFAEPCMPVYTISAGRPRPPLRISAKPNASAAGFTPSPAATPIAVFRYNKSPIESSCSRAADVRLKRRSKRRKSLARFRLPNGRSTLASRSAGSWRSTGSGRAWPACSAAPWFARRREGPSGYSALGAGTCRPCQSCRKS